jgi:hypothetical protein
MEIADLPLEIICEIAKSLDVNDIRRMETALNICMPDYIIMPGYKKIFDLSVNELNKMDYGFQNFPDEESSCHDYLDHSISYAYIRDSRHHKLQTTRFSRDFLYTRPYRPIETVEGIKRCVEVEFDLVSTQPQRIFIIIKS